MNYDWIKTRQTRYGAYLAAYVVVIVAILFAANFLANRYNKSVDATKNKRFSLSDQTQKVVKNLKQDVTVQYFDKTSSFGSARDLLDRYDNLSPKLKVEYVDPDKKPAIAKAAGVRNYGTVLVQVGAKTQEAKSVTEEEITGALVRALKGGERLACFVQGSGEHSLEDTGRSGYSQAKEYLEKNNYKTRTVSLIEKAEVPKECTVLVVAGPRFDYLQPAVDAVKKYVEGGGRALVMVDPPLKMGREDVSENPPLTALVQNWGVTPDKDLVLDTSGIGQIFGLSEVVPLVTSYESHQIVREMKEIATAFPLARSLDVKSGEKLFSTTGNAFATTNLSSAQVSLNPAKDKKGPFVLGAAGNAGQGRWVVVGSSSWAANNILRFNGNRDLFLNMMAWLSSDEDLISIRPKEQEDRRLQMSRAQMNSLFYLTVIGFPLLVVAAGLGVWWRRR